MEYYNVVNADYEKLVKNQILYPVFKIELLDEYENAYQELIEDISSQSTGSITCQMQQGVRKTVNFSVFDPTGKFLPNPNDKFFWINKKFKIYLGMRKKRQYIEPVLWDSGRDYSISSARIPLAPMNASQVENEETSLFKLGEQVQKREDIYWFSKGIYIITGISVSDGEGKIVSIDGVDKYGAFGNETGFNEMIGNFQLDRGILLSEAIEEILSQDIGNGVKLDPKKPIIDPFFQHYKIPIAFTKGPGSYLAELLNDLASSLHADIYYDNDGRLNIKRTLNYEDYRNLSNVWNFKYGDSEYLNSAITFEINKVANSICVVGDNPSATTLPTARAENNNPRSPVSIQKIGRKTRYKESSVIQTTQEAQDYANYLLKMSSAIGHTANFTTTLIPHLDLDQTISITDERYNYSNEIFLISSLTFPIGIGEISIGASNIAELPEE